MFVDEAGFYLQPLLVRTYAPVGLTPIVRVPLTHDHLSAIGGITPERRIFMQMQEQAYRVEHVVEFLCLLLRKIRGKLLVIWDGSPIHRAKTIKEFLAAGAAKRLHLERLPGYAPVETMPGSAFSFFIPFLNWDYILCLRTRFDRRRLECYAEISKAQCSNIIVDDGYPSKGGIGASRTQPNLYDAGHLFPRVTINVT